MKIVFLDIDGVLNGHEYFKELTEIKGGKQVYEDMLNPKGLALLDRILDETGAVIVMSSTWRYAHPLTKIQWMFEKQGFRNSLRIIGATPDHPEVCEEVRAWLKESKDSTPYDSDRIRLRGNEIQTWLSQVGDVVTSFVILDDDRDMAHLAHRHIHTSIGVGLLEADVERAIKMLLE